MQGYHQKSYGESYADGYDTLYAKAHYSDSVIEVLARHAAAGPALELGIGSGRIACPLAARGIEVDGIEISPAMIELLNSAAAGLPVRAILGSFADFEPPRRYSLVYCVMNTFFLLNAREEQMQAFANTARALNDNGVFILETKIMPDLRHIHMGQEVRVVELAADSVTLQFSLHKPDKQIIETQRVILGDKGVKLHPWVFRYALPNELDEMAMQSGLHLKSRWADWDGEPFTRESIRQISMYTRHGDHDVGESSTGVAH